MSEHVTMSKEEILAKLEEKEFRTRCLAQNMCPRCGHDLINEGGLTTQKVCKHCHVSYVGY